MNSPTPLSQFPKISVNQGSALVNGQMTTTPSMSMDGGRGPRGRAGESGGSDDLAGILDRLTALEERLNAATVDANCSDGTVTVVLNI
jgi:hypothetical protein